MRPSDQARSQADGERNTKLLIGWKQIAYYLGMGVRTVQRHERLDGLPIRRPAGHPKSAVIATVVELDAWVVASPTRASFKAPSANAMTSSRDGMARMGALCDEMERLRDGRRDSLQNLHSSIHVVGVGPTKTYPDAELGYISFDRKPKRERPV